MFYKPPLDKQIDSRLWILTILGDNCMIRVALRCPSMFNFRQHGVAALTRFATTKRYAVDV